MKVEFPTARPVGIPKAKAARDGNPEGAGGNASASRARKSALERKRARRNVPARLSFSEHLAIGIEPLRFAAVPSNG
jgi:hypothetical protein